LWTCLIEVLFLISPFHVLRWHFTPQFAVIPSMWDKWTMPQLRKSYLLILKHAGLWSV
jgi:hypothetical protein